MNVSRNQVHYHSQLGQDQWIIECVFPKKRNGFFVDFGAADGVRISNTYALEKFYAWRGICVEPGPEFQALKRNRQCITDNSCLGGKTGEKVEFLLVAGAADLSGIRRHLRKEHQGRELRGTLMEKETTSLNDLLAVHDAPQRIEFLSIDTEGSEYAILREFPFSLYSFGAITVEHNHQQEQRQRMFELLTRNGYRRVRMDGRWGIEDWYVNPAFPGVAVE
ncbi:MAG: FkbM family methyltransferase [Planctomycetes bacterium]|nr:FkbM family methyltransferase [Planctomycetota bacterium]